MQCIQPFARPLSDSIVVAILQSAWTVRLAIAGVTAVAVVYLPQQSTCRSSPRIAAAHSVTVARFAVTLPIHRPGGTSRLTYQAVKCRATGGADMRIGVLSDVHANLPALEAVLEDLPPVDALANAGDVIGYNPWPRECLEAIRERDVASVMGNHDRAVATGSSFRFNSMAAAGVRHARDELEDDQLAWLADLPDEQSCLEGRVRIVHGHPDDPDRYTYPEDFSPSLLEDADVLVLGHTHVQHAERYPEGIVLNPGSVGQPRDRDPRAAYAILDLDEMDVECRRVEYDVERVVEAVDAAGLPEAIGQRLRQGR